MGKFTILGLSNIIIFQWLCIRLTKHQNEKLEIYWSFQYWVVPLTGWFSDFKYFNFRAKYKYL